MSNLAQKQGWEFAETVASDGSSRRYTRVQKNGRTAILMECHGDTPSHNIPDYLRIGAWLRENGFRVPEVYEAEDHFVLLEDFGSVSFTKAMQKGDKRELYKLAADVLKKLAQTKLTIDLPEYFASHIHEGHRRVIDWYVPVLRGTPNEDDLAAEYFQVWAEIEQGLPPAKQGFVHADYHIDNLMFLNQEKGLNRCGIIDFQGAMKGPLPYDLGNLLEDARVSVPEDIQKELMVGLDENVLAWYRVLTTQFHSRVIGQFIKMAMLDGKTQYLVHIPRLAAYIGKALHDPLLAPLKSFYKGHKISFTQTPAVDLEKIRPLISSGAF